MRTYSSKIKREFPIGTRVKVEGVPGAIGTVGFPSMSNEEVMAMGWYNVIPITIRYGNNPTYQSWWKKGRVTKFEPVLPAGGDWE